MIRRCGAFFVMCCSLRVSAQSAAVLYETELSQLQPDEPIAYFELAEAVADASSSVDDRRLAQRLYVLAYVVAGETGMHSWVQPSACIGLASLDSDPVRRRWLRAVASLLDGRYAALASDDEPFVRFSRESRLAFAEFLGLARAGRGALARQRLERPDVEGLIEVMGDTVVDGRVAPSIARMEAEVGIWPCRQCRNARSVPDPADPETERMLCPNCGGNPGPRLSPEELEGYLALEAIALQADGESWAAEHAMLRTDPIFDPRLDGINSMFQIDPERTVYRSGDWIKPESE